MHRALRLGFLAALAVGPLVAQSASDLLARLDRFARTFAGVRATVAYTVHTPPLTEDTTETGLLTIKRFAPGKMQFMIGFTGADAYTIALREQTVELYRPKLDEIQVIDLRKYRDIAQKLVLLGFGTAGRDLAANFEIKDIRREAVGREVSTHLELVPKSPDVLERLKRVELWIADKNDCPVQQKFYFPGGEYKIAQFSDVKINPTLAASEFDLPKHAKRVRVNKVGLVVGSTIAIFMICRPQP